MTEYTRIYERACKYANRKAGESGETDSREVIYHARWFIEEYRNRFDSNFLHFGIEYVDIDEAEREMYYINQGDTYAETIVCEDGVCFVSSWGDWFETAENTYCENENKIRCAYCGEYTDFQYGKDETDSVECECGHYVDGSDVPELGSQLSNCTEIWDSDESRGWVDNSQLETHKTKSRYTTLVIRLQYTEYYDSEWCETHGKYHVGLLAVTPGIVRAKERKSLLDFIGQPQENWDSWDNDARCQACIEYGYYACLWQTTSNDGNAVLREAEKQRLGAQVMGGFMLDKAQNAIGSSGWDFMRGDILAGLRK